MLLPPSVRWGCDEASKETLPDGQFLVVVPNPLINQWISEAKRMLQKDAWNIIRYPSSVEDRISFWSEVWPKVTGGRHSVLLVVPHSVSVSD